MRSAAEPQEEVAVAELEHQAAVSWLEVPVLAEKLAMVVLEAVAR